MGHFPNRKQKKITVDKLGDPCKTEKREDDKEKFAELKGQVPEKVPRYILYDFGFTNKEGRKISKLAFIFW